MTALRPVAAVCPVTTSLRLADASPGRLSGRRSGFRMPTWLGLMTVIVLGALGLGGLAPVQAQTPTPTTTIQNGAGDTRLQLNDDGGLYVPGTFVTDGTAANDLIPATGAGTRMMWYPAKAAFRAGRVGAIRDGTQWDASKVGDYSAAFGLDTKASGTGATAMGVNTTASGFQATAMGLGATASGNRSTAMGVNTIASGTEAMAMGIRAAASDLGAMAMGFETTANEDYATAMGYQTEASAVGTTAMGVRATASGFGTTAMGYETTATGSDATAMGSNTTASGPSATAMGRETIAASNTSLSIGIYNNANTSDDNTLFVVGNGSTSSSRSDALVLKESGNLTISGSLAQNSDRRLKTGIEPLGGGILRKLGALRPVRYKFKDPATHPSGEQVGLIAQEVRKAFPALVSEGAGGTLSVSYSKMTAVVLKGVQEQQAQIEAKEAAITELQAENESIRVENERIKARLAALEQQSPSSLPAGLTGPWGLAVLAGLGALTAGLLWRRRT